VTAGFPRTEGRRLFGADPAAYDRARRPYPERVYTILVERCGLRPATRVLEIGPGTGKATRPLLELGADPLVAVEPDPALAAYLRESLAPYGERLDLRVESFEQVALEPASFELAAAASAFHWIDPAVGLRKVLHLLRPGAWWAMWWNIHGDPDRPDPFHDATEALLGGLPRGPHDGRSGRPPFALDTDARCAELAAMGLHSVGHERIPWTASFDAGETRELYSTFSPIIRLDPPARTRLLDAVAAIAGDQFAGRVERPMLTVVYTARVPA
jgi:SAM-dependent methyltransferase